MIAVEVGVSQSYESLRAAISWSVCALDCRLGIVMCIREQGRGRTPDPPLYSSIQVENAAVDEADQDFPFLKTVASQTPTPSGKCNIIGTTDCTCSTL
ncbi:hypothetical protein V1504DRAFT_461110, partial [Lipomyces starkeyi]